MTNKIKELNIGDKVKVKGENKIRIIHRILPDGGIMFGDKGNIYFLKDIEPLTEHESKNRCKKCDARTIMCIDAPCQDYPITEEKEMNLCKILKGHEGEKFYNPLFGNIELSYIDERYIVFTYNLGCNELFIKHNGNSKDTDEPAVFPSKDQRDWNKWDKDNNYKTPKTWIELIRTGKAIEYNLSFYDSQGNIVWVEDSPIEKSTMSLLKIHQLIEVGYGGNITNKDWKNPYIAKYEIIYNSAHNQFIVNKNTGFTKSLIAFYTKEQAEEFLLYTENIQLLHDYYINN